MSEEGEKANKEELSRKVVNKVSQEQVHGLLFGDRLSWQTIIYDLINTEELDPWDINLSLLAQKYLEKVKEIEETNFFVSSKVLLAAALLLRIKSEILLNEYLPSLDEILFGKKEEKRYFQERIELDEDIPELSVRTPLPRFRKVTLDELMQALGKAITTENRRIKRIIVAKQQEFETYTSIPKKRINIRDQIKGVYDKLRGIFSDREHKLAFSEFAGKSDEERVSTFVPLLHLDNQHKVWLEQESHFNEIWILLKDIYEKQNSIELEKMKKEVEEEMNRLSFEMSAEDKKRADDIEKNFSEPIGNS